MTFRTILIHLCVLFTIFKQVNSSSHFLNIQPPTYKNLAVLALICSMCFTSNCQIGLRLHDNNESPYATNWQVDASVISLSLGLVVSQYITKDKASLNPEYVASLDSFAFIYTSCLISDNDFVLVDLL